MNAYMYVRVQMGKTPLTDAIVSCKGVTDKDVLKVKHELTAWLRSKEDDPPPGSVPDESLWQEMATTTRSNSSSSINSVVKVRTKHTVIAE